MAKKRGSKNSRGFELSPLNLIVLLFALAFVMQTCSTGKPTNEDLPPFPQAPPGASVVGNFLTGFQTAPQPVIKNDLIVKMDQNGIVYLNYAPQYGVLEAVYYKVYLNGKDTGQGINSLDTRNSNIWKVATPEFPVTSQFSLKDLNLPEGIYDLQILAYAKEDNAWNTNSYLVHIGKLEVQGFFAGLAAPVTEETPETVAPEEKVDIVIDETPTELLTEELPTELDIQTFSSYPSSGSDKYTLKQNPSIFEIEIADLLNSILVSNGHDSISLNTEYGVALKEKGYNSGIIVVENTVSGKYIALTLIDEKYNPGFVYFFDVGEKKPIESLPKGDSAKHMDILTAIKLQGEFAQ